MMKIRDYRISKRHVINKDQKGKIYSPLPFGSEHFDLQSPSLRHRVIDGRVQATLDPTKVMEAES